MYGTKEKIKILREMQSPEAAEVDLELLRRLSPGNALLKSATHSPGRYAERVLRALLDITTREEIRTNRRQEMAVSQEDDSKNANASDGSGQSAKGDSSDASTTDLLVQLEVLEAAYKADLEYAKLNNLDTADIDEAYRIAKERLSQVQTSPEPPMDGEDSEDKSPASSEPPLDGEDSKDQPPAGKTEKKSSSKKPNTQKSNGKTSLTWTPKKRS